MLYTRVCQNRLRGEYDTTGMHVICVFNYWGSSIIQVDGGTGTIFFIILYYYCKTKPN